MTRPDEFAQYKPSPELAKLISAAEAMTRRHTRFDWTAALANVPLLFLTYGLVSLSEDDTRELATTSMPDTWVEEAANLPGAATTNLRRLHRALKAKGFVSIREANDFCGVECAREQLAFDKEQREARQEDARTSAGMLALTRRLGSQEVDFSPEEVAKSILGRAQGIAQAGADVAAFAAKQAAWAGKGLGAAADLVRSARDKVGI